MTLGLNPQQVANALKTLQVNQVRILTGTVVGSTISQDPNSVPVRLDNDSGGSAEAVIVNIPSICGIMLTNTRVSILTIPPAGMLIVGTIGTNSTILNTTDVPLTAQSGISPPAMSLALRAGMVTAVNPVTYFSNDTWIVPSNPLFLGVEVKVQAGGGGSGGIAATAAGESSTSGGGQGGAYISGIFLARRLPRPGSAVNIDVGAGGLAAAAGNNPGGVGGNSSFLAPGALVAAATAGDTTITVDYGFQRGNSLTLSPGLPAQETVSVIGDVSAGGSNRTLTLLAPLVNSHLIAATVLGTVALAQGGDGGQGGGASASLNNTTQRGGNAVQGYTLFGGFGLTDIRGGDEGGTGSRSGGGGNGTILPGFGGGSRTGGIRGIDSRGGVDQIAPLQGTQFGGGASGRGADVPAGLAAGGGAAGGPGLVTVNELYRT